MSEGALRHAEINRTRLAYPFAEEPIAFRRVVRRWILRRQAIERLKRSGRADIQAA